MKKTRFVVLVLVVLIYFLFINFQKSSLSNICNNVFGLNDYNVISVSKNDDYSGIGQKIVDGKDGYFTTFTTFDDNKKIYKEYKQNVDASWSEHSYWGGTMAENGCGITALAIILSGYGKDFSPEVLRQKYYPVMNYDNFSNELLNEFCIENSDFYFDNVHLSDKSILKHLQSNRPILVCVWNRPTNNRWTTASHYMVLLAADNSGKVYVSNPNGGKYDSKSSGWYDIKEVSPFIAKAIYIESY